MIDDKFAKELQDAYRKTTDGNWYHKTRHGLGMSNDVVLTDKQPTLAGSAIGSFGEFGEYNAKFLVLVHNNMYKIMELLDQCRLISQWHQRGIIGEPNRALWMKDLPIPAGWIVEDRIPEVDGFIPIKKVEK